MSYYFENHMKMVSKKWLYLNETLVYSNPAPLTTPAKPGHIVIFMGTLTTRLSSAASFQLFGLIYAKMFKVWEYKIKMFHKVGNLIQQDSHLVNWFVGIFTTKKN